MSKKNPFELNNTDKNRAMKEPRHKKDNDRQNVSDKNKKKTGHPNEYGGR